MPGGATTLGSDDPVWVEKIRDEVALEDLNVGREKLDAYFGRAEGERPDDQHDEFDIEIPVIDLSPTVNLARLRAEIAASPEKMADLKEDIAACEAGKAGVEKEIRAACEEYGFFQMVNHGFPVSLVEQYREFAREILDLPLEEKMKISETGPVPGQIIKPGYGSMKRASAVAQTRHGNIWNEAFELEMPDLFYPGNTERIVDTLWPEASDSGGKGPAFRSIAEDFGKESRKLVCILLELMTSSLGLPVNAAESFLHSKTDNTYSRLRVNHFPVCAQPKLTWGIYSHADPSIFTWVHQDSVGGLQFSYKDGTWHGVRPIPDSFVVNIGDFLQAWTNGRFISAQHRVVANSKCRRFFVANFVVGEIDEVTPRPELVDAEHPLQYRPFTRSEYMKMLVTSGLNSDRKGVLQNFSNTQDGKPSSILEAYLQHSELPACLQD